MSNGDKITIDLGPVVNAVNNLRQEVKEGTQKTVEEIHRVAESAAKTELAKQRAELKAIGPVIQQQNTQIEGLKQKTFRFIEEIRKKFDKIAHELWESYIRDIRRLGAHIFDILETEYQRGMENRVRGADFDVFTGITQKVYEKSSQNLTSWMGRAGEAAQQFLQLRKQFKMTLADCKIDSEMPGEREFAVPVWIVKLQDEEGNIQIHALGLSKLDRLDHGEYRYSLKEVPEYQEVSQMVQRNLETIVNSISWKEATIGQKTAIIYEIESISKQEAISGELRKILLGRLKEKALSLG